jgi:hypothetical protein
MRNLTRELEFPFLNDIISTVYTDNLSTWKAETGGLQVQGQSGLHRRLEGSLSYIVRPISKKQWLECCLVVEHFPSMAKSLGLMFSATKFS